MIQAVLALLLASKVAQRAADVEAGAVLNLQTSTRKTPRYVRNDNDPWFVGDGAVRYEQGFNFTKSSVPIPAKASMPIVSQPASGGTFVAAPNQFDPNNSFYRSNGFYWTGSQWVMP